jgi:adenylosuccinate lyase
MLARTHGQPAVPTTIGKEFVVFALRLHKQVQILKHTTLTGKLNGAVGNFNAHVAAYPDVDWTAFSSIFIRRLGLAYISATTQINPYEDVIELLQIISRINGILIDFNKDMWRYISDNWFILKFSKTEVGSSTMPQKVNPIDFENSEGNLSIANSIIEGISRNLSTSRLQRDLTDSTLSRNFGVVFGYSLVAYRNCLKGIQKISPNIPEITDALMKNWIVLSEAVQTILRSEGVDDPYTLLLNLSKGETITMKDWNSFINNLPYEGKRKRDLLALSPVTYIGLAQQITEQTIQNIREATDQKNSTKRV